MYYYYWAYPTMVGAVVDAVAMIATYVLARRDGAEWPSLSVNAAAGALHRTNE